MGFHRAIENLTEKNWRTEYFPLCTGVCQTWFETHFPLWDGKLDSFLWKTVFPDVPFVRFISWLYILNYNCICRH